MENKYMEMAINLAEKGRGKTSPNPFVGAVIVKNGVVVGKGFTQPWGKDHAEVQALKQAGNNAEGSDIYVTLEPCCHFGKTPPCADALIKAKIKNVYIGIVDPNPKVNGKGIEKLKQAGINVVSGVFEKKITRQLEYYICNQIKRRPFVIMKNAVSLNGFITNKIGSKKSITDEKTKQCVHNLRQEADAIITGIGTVNCDNSMLNVRLKNAYKQPVRIILDPMLEIDLNSNIVKSASKQKTIIVYANNCQNAQKKQNLAKYKLDLIEIESNAGFLNLPKLLEILYKQNISVIMLEAGSKLCSSFLNQNLVDKIFYYVSFKIFANGLSVFNNLENDVENFEISKCQKLDNDIEIILTRR